MTLNQFPLNRPVLSQIAIFAGMKFTPGSFTSCLIATGPAWTLLASWILRYVPKLPLECIFYYFKLIIIVHRTNTLISSHYSCDRLEHLAITERRSQAKLLGMVMVISGGLVVGLYDGPTITVLQPSRISSRNVVYSLSTNWIRGPLLVSFSVLASVLYNILMVSFVVLSKNSSLIFVYDASLKTLNSF